ncbi:MarR family winged helix-turn-helix transcriptional regulator [Allokutzneria albata]|uniref:DNA-binding transcriptional regulator, MarR family n=1 Tax=Allokutzneria albata TaxID=211114 RepID=A0A1G9ZK59_ALLAB|nr:MarR family winged helix-turn-helix transcriptional regulator [Allokutzneria albata]SDN20996.1 DNA-binding transcriptional regulator, MarR family [Allokutzneria albata]
MAPSTQTCVELIQHVRELVQLRHAVAHRQVEPGEPSFALISLLSELERRGECAGGALAQERAVDPSVVSRQIAQLERAGLVSRRPAPGDGRVHLISATARGKAVLDGWRRRQTEWLRRALGSWPDDDVHRVSSLIEAMARAVRDALEPTTPTGAAR